MKTKAPAVLLRLLRNRKHWNDFEPQVDELSPDKHLMCSTQASWNVP